MKRQGDLPILDRKAEPLGIGSFLSPGNRERWRMNLVVLAGGVGLILWGLWDRSDGERSLLLFGGGALLVVIGGLMTLAGLDLEL